MSNPIQAKIINATDIQKATPYKIVNGILTVDKSMVVMEKKHQRIDTSPVPINYKEKHIKILPELLDDTYHISMMGNETHCLWTPLPYSVIYKINIIHDFPAQDWTINVWWSNEPKGMRLDNTPQFKPLTLNRDYNTLLLAENTTAELSSIERSFSQNTGEDYWFNIQNMTTRPNGYSLNMVVFERISNDQNAILT